MCEGSASPRTLAIMATDKRPEGLFDKLLGPAQGSHSTNTSGGISQSSAGPPLPPPPRLIRPPPFQLQWFPAAIFGSWWNHHIHHMCVLFLLPPPPGSKQELDGACQLVFPVPPKPQHSLQRVNGGARVIVRVKKNVLLTRLELLL